MLNIKNFYKNIRFYFKKITNSLNLTEKTIAIILLVVIIFSGFSLLNKLNSLITNKVPAHGGTLTEGLIGPVRFINPVLETNESDRDLTYLIYSGLMRATANGDLIPDLAESYSISEDNLTYTFKIRDNAYFHDGEKVTTADIKFTLNMIQDLNIRSPKRNNWVGVNTEIINDQEIVFKLKQSYSPFLENTTLGILPKHIWENATADEFVRSPYNDTTPIGSGPYKVSAVKKNNLGTPTFYELTAFNKNTLGKPFITTLKFNIYPNEEDLKQAYLANKIDSVISLSPKNLSTLINNKKINYEKITLPRIFGVFFNQNQAKIFLNKEVRQALNMTVDKDRIISEVLDGYGKKINSPIPNGIINKEEEGPYIKDEAIKKAQEILSKAGWKFNEKEMVWEKKISKNETQKLAFSISTSNTTDLKKVAEIIKEGWGQLGAQVEILTFDPSDLNQSVIGPRKYDALLFGQTTNRSLDYLFAYWHSSQRNTGSNFSMYTNTKADNLLEEARQISDQKERLKKYTLFETEIKNDLPAIFLYSPEYMYFLPTKIQGFKSGLINNRAERFEEISNWYIETDKIWKFLSKK